MVTIESLGCISGLEPLQLRAGQQGRHNIIRWPYVAENADIKDWIEGGELIFVTGLNWNWQANDFIQLITTAKARNASGLVLLTHSPYLEEIPHKVLAFADQCGFPVIEQPWTLPMVKVTELLSNAIIMTDLEHKSTRWLVQHLLESAVPSDMTLLKASEHGIDVHSNWSVAVINPASNQTGDLIRSQHLISQFLADFSGALPVLEYHQGWLACLPLGSNSPDTLAVWQQLAQHLARQGIDCHLGISEARTLRSLRQVVLQARQSADFSAAHQGYQVVHYNSLGIAQIFSRLEDPQFLADFCKQHLGGLYGDQDKHNQLLKHTLSSYLDNLGSLRQTAAHLNIHRNTLSNRLSKIEQLTGLSLNNAQQRLSIQSALIAERLLFSSATNTQPSTDKLHF